MSALIVRAKDSNSPGWHVVLESTGEVILSTSWGMIRDRRKPYTVSIPWPGFKSNLTVADEASSLALAEKVYERLLQRLGVTA